MAGRSDPPPWSVPVTVHEVPESGRRFNLKAEESAREAIAKSIGVRSLPRLEAGFDVTRHGRDGLRVTGDVSATVGQTCVVTLEPLDSAVEEKIDLVFVPTPIAPTPEQGPAKMAADDVAEPLVGGTIDLGAIATEFLTLGIDPYPRKAGAEFTPPLAADEGEHPFAALAALKKGKS
jgi:uncharacterized metal-binding protein YceD (DUF177 family)